MNIAAISRFRRPLVPDDSIIRPLWSGNFRALAISVLLFQLSMFSRAAADPMATVITSDSATSQSSDIETTSYFRGHVVVLGTNLRIECDDLQVISQRSGDKADTFGQQNSFKYILATGNVRITQGDREAICGRAEVLPQENKITLTGSPVVTDHGNGVTYAGEPLVLYRNERRVEGKNVRITAPPIKDLGFDKDEPPPAPQPPADTAQPHP
jgi:lipopolysaccharide export system protein LptA